MRTALRASDPALDACSSPCEHAARWSRRRDGYMSLDDRLSDAWLCLAAGAGAVGRSSRRRGSRRRRVVVPVRRWTGGFALAGQKARAPTPSLVSLSGGEGRGGKANRAGLFAATLLYYDYYYWALRAAHNVLAILLSQRVIQTRKQSSQPTPIQRRPPSVRERVRVRVATTTTRGGRRKGVVE